MYSKLTVFLQDKSTAKAETEGEERNYPPSQFELTGSMSGRVTARERESAQNCA